MPIQAKCPGCGAAYTLVDDQRGKRVRCKKCDETFVVGSAIKAQAPAPPPPPRRESVRPSAASPAPRRRPRDEEDEDTEERHAVLGIKILALHGAREDGESV